MVVAALLVVGQLPPVVQWVVPTDRVLPPLEAKRVPSLVQPQALLLGPVVLEFVGTRPTHSHLLAVLPLEVVCPSLAPTPSRLPHMFPPTLLLAEHSIH